MANKTRLQIMLPDQIIYDEDVDFVLLRTSRGDMGVLPGHEPYAAQLVHGQLRAYIDKAEVADYTVQGGFALIEPEKVAVLTGLAGKTGEMGALLADMERAIAQRREREEAANLEMRRAEEALRRALVHQEVSADAIIRGHEERFGEGAP